MVCVYCSGKTEVVNSRPQRKSNHVWRRRHCSTCGATFSTQESAQYDLAWRVRSGAHVRPFSRMKLFMSLYKSCEHRKTALNDAEGLTDTIIGKVAPLTADGVVSSHDIVHTVQVALNRFDKAASVHYQAFHKV